MAWTLFFTLRSHRNTFIFADLICIFFNFIAHIHTNFYLGTWQQLPCLKLYLSKPWYISKL
ncbi:hypothetical protein ACE6H2_026534 [Prunus campanulata]